MARDLEAWRPRYHYTPARHWMSDPNGLVWLNGEYHLFYQHNPQSIDWGHMSWGHAVSRDLLHWQELPVAIPEDARVSIYSGSAVCDANNSSGLGSTEQPPLVAIYTGCQRRPEGGQAQELAHSLDGGRSFTPYPGNPVLDLGLRDFRDPKVCWHAPSKRWVMVVVLPDEHRILFYGSTNLREWQHLSAFGPAGEAVGIWECPDLIEVPVEQDGSTDLPATRWLLKVDTFSGHPGGTGAQYFVGYFDGQRLIEDEPGGAPQWADHGSDFYAAMSFNHLPANHTRPLWLGWMGNHRYAAKVPTSPWRGAMSLPRELSLRRHGGRWRLMQRPLPAIMQWRGHGIHLPARQLKDDVLSLPVRGNAMELCFSIDAVDGLEAGLEVLAAADGGCTRLGYNAKRQAVFIDRTHSGVLPDDTTFAGRRHVSVTPPSPGKPLNFQVFIDAGSVEIFADDGMAVLTEQVFPYAHSTGVSLYVIGGGASFGAMAVWPLTKSKV
jgi:fructan beta-fructosidase